MPFPHSHHQNNTKNAILISIQYIKPERNIGLLYRSTLLLYNREKLYDFMTLTACEQWHTDAEIIMCFSNVARTVRITWELFWRWIAHIWDLSEKHFFIFRCTKKITKLNVAYIVFVLLVAFLLQLSNHFYLQ